MAPEIMHMARKTRAVRDLRVENMCVAADHIEAMSGVGPDSACVSIEVAIFKEPGEAISPWCVLTFVWSVCAPYVRECVCVCVYCNICVESVYVRMCCVCALPYGARLQYSPAMVRRVPWCVLKSFCRERVCVRALSWRGCMCVC